MPEQALIITQLLNKAANFQRNHPFITQSQIAKECGIGECNFSQALAGKRGLSADSCLKLHKLLSLTERQIAFEFNMPVMTSQIIKLQEPSRSYSRQRSSFVA
jgi:transcriptional regulator with XRE-family HTH domain